MPKPKKGYGKRGRPSKKDIENLKAAQAIMQSKNITDAYMKTHPKSTKESAGKNAHRLLNEDVFKMVKELLQLERIAATNRENLEKMLHVVIARYLRGEENGNVYVAAIKLLTQLVPEFKDRYEVEGLDSKDEAAIDKELRERYGIDPSKIN